MRYVALLRGINVNPRTRVAMADLRAMLEKLGYTGVRTHLQSGNAVFTTDKRPPGQIAAAIEQRIADDLGMAVAVIVRTAGELRAVVEGNPLEVRDPAKFAV